MGEQSVKEKRHWKWGGNTLQGRTLGKCTQYSFHLIRGAGGILQCRWGRGPDAQEV